MAMWRMWLVEIMEHEESEPTPNCCIYKVPIDIRRMNEKAYTPQLISIGPFHHGNEKLVDMEKRKRRYVKSFCRRLPSEKVSEIVWFVEHAEQDIRDAYAEPIDLVRSELVKIIFCDAIFIIEHFLRACFGNSDDDTLPRIPAVETALSLDFLLLENQLPFFVLDGIYNLVFEEVTFREICNVFFTNAFNFEIDDDQSVVNFIDLIRTALVKGYPNVEEMGPIRDLPCALELHGSGVKFKSTEGEGLLDIRFSNRDWLKAHDLHIPCFVVYDSTECLLRNVMALEQCHYPSETKVCNYVRLMDYLINTEKDVELLVAKGIISNVVGDNAEVANMFNKLGSHIILDEKSCYYKICEDLKAHYRSPWNKTKATLKSVYFTNLWRSTATIAAVILLFLAAIQAICSIIQVI